MTKKKQQQCNKLDIHKWNMAKIMYVQHDHFKHSVRKRLTAESEHNFPI